MADYVVVGGGSAGCVVAARLSERSDAQVILLEAGPADSNPLIHVPLGFHNMMDGPLTFRYRTVPLRQANGRVMTYPIARVLGGGSSINAMVYMRGNANDFDTWKREEGCDGWDYAGVLPYFRRAEDNERLADQFHGTGGPVGVSDPISPMAVSKAFIRAAQQAGIPLNPDFNGAKQEGCGFYQVTQRKAKRSSTATAYLKPARARPNLKVVTDATVTKLRIEGGRAVGVEYRVGNSRTSEFARAETEVIVCSGAVGSPKLLMLSGIGDADELKALGIKPVHQLPGVGQNLQDHVDIYTICELSEGKSLDTYSPKHRRALAALEYLTFKRGPATCNLAEAGAVWWADRSEVAPDIQFHFLPGSALEPGQPGPAGAGYTVNATHCRPRSRGTVKLSSADPEAPPIIDPNFWSDPYDLKMSIAGFRMARDIISQPALRAITKTEFAPGIAVKTDEEIAEYGRRLAKTDYHPVGTCKMGRDEMAVVDPELRVRGLDALRIVDASVMPRLVSANTNAASIMIGEKGSDLIRGNRAPPLQS